MTRIDDLTSEQLDILPVVRDEWLYHGLSCHPADRQAAEEGVEAAYQAASIPPPPIRIWLQSPMAGAVGMVLLLKALERLKKQVRGQVGGQVWGQVGGQVWDQVWGQVWGQVGGQVWGQVGGQVWGQVGGQVRDQVWGQVRGQVRDQVGDQVWDQVRGQVRGQVWDQVRDQVGGQVGDQVWDQVGGQVRGQVWDQVRWSLWGQHDAAYMSFFDCFDRLGLPEITAPTRGLRQVAKSAGWWWALRGAVILTERPTELHRDAQGRLHSETGPALLYPDGWGIWAVHGVRVPQRVIENAETITVEEILAEANTEIRRVMIEQFGWERFAAAGHLQLLDEQPDPANPGHTLRLYDLPPRLLNFPVRLLVCTNASPERDGTRRQFGLTVDAAHRDAVAAAASTFGVDPATYRQLSRAT